MGMGGHGGGRRSCPMAGFDTNNVEHQTGSCYFWVSKTEWGPHIAHFQMLISLEAKCHGTNKCLQFLKS